MTQSAIATAADYAEGLLTARRVKNVLVGIILVMLLAEQALFFLARYKVDLSHTTIASATAQSMLPRKPEALDLLKYFVGGISFLGVVVPILLAATLLLIVNIMLVGRLIGLSKLIGALIACWILILMLFPWQAFLINQSFSSRDFMVPGILYTWDDVFANARNHPTGAQAVIYWGRFVGGPLAGIVVLILVAVKSGRGLRLALGEESPRLPGDLSVN